MLWNLRNLPRTLQKMSMRASAPFPTGMADISFWVCMRSGSHPWRFMGDEEMLRRAGLILTGEQTQ